MQGLLIINKPIGFTSQDVVSKVKKILNVKKAGHTGTLDPMATGVLPILIGDYTKLSKYLIEHDKTYVAEIFLGKSTDTGDQEGNVILEKDVPKLDNELIKNILNEFLGVTKQIPPMYSAIKVKGKKLYEYARKGESVEVEPRDIQIDNIEFIKYENNIIKFKVSCSKGTYIRVLCEDIAKKLNTCGYMYSLERIRVDQFFIENAFTFEQLENMNNIEEKLILMKDIFGNLPKINLRRNADKHYLNGVKMTYKYENGVYNIYNSESVYLGLGIVEDDLLKRDIVITEE